MISISLKNETSYEDSFCIPVEASLKNEIKVMGIVLFPCQDHLKMKQRSRD
jgi:hypothetical protein